MDGSRKIDGSLQSRAAEADHGTKAAEYWAFLRQSGIPTSSPDALDADAILAGQAAMAGQPDDTVMIATTNLAHLNRFPRIRAGLGTRFGKPVCKTTLPSQPLTPITIHHRYGVPIDHVRVLSPVAPAARRRHNRRDASSRPRQAAPPKVGAAGPVGRRAAGAHPWPPPIDISSSDSSRCRTA